MIRQHVLQDFSSFVSGNSNINADLILDAFVAWYYGHQVNEYYKKAGKSIILVDVDKRYRLYDFSADMIGKDIKDRMTDQVFRLKVRAAPLDVYRDNQFGWQGRLKSNDELSVFVDQIPDADASEDTARPAINGLRGLRKELSEIDHSFLETIINQAAGDVVVYLQGCLESRHGRKTLPDDCFALFEPNRLKAAHRVISHSFDGEKGEDVLVQMLLGGRISPAFSYNFGTSEEWSAQDRSSRYRERVEPSPEEDALLQEFDSFLKEVFSKDQ